ncbi:MAG: hypothetical protein ACYDDA_05065 [Acidiferrobacteraceae bacterium]
MRLQREPQQVSKIAHARLHNRPADHCEPGLRVRVHVPNDAPCPASSMPLEEVRFVRNDQVWLDVLELLGALDEAQGLVRDHLQVGRQAPVLC